MPRYIAIAAITIDGRIAKNSHHFSNWTSVEDKNFLHAILDICDVVLVGNSTYKWPKPLSKRNCIVLTRSLENKDKRGLTYLDPNKHPASTYKNMGIKIAILGGTQIYSYCLEKINRRTISDS